MSTLKIDTLEGLTSGKSETVDALIAVKGRLDNVGDESVTTSTGTQTIATSLNDRVIAVNSVAEIEAISSAVAGDVISLNAGGRSGTFDVVAGDFSTELSDDTLNGVYVGLADNLTATNKVARRRYVGPVDVRWFGAIGDGVFNDSAAFQGAANMGNFHIGACEVYWLVGGLTVPAGRTVTGERIDKYTAFDLSSIEGKNAVVYDTDAATFISWGSRCTINNCSFFGVDRSRDFLDTGSGGNIRMNHTSVYRCSAGFGKATGIGNSRLFECHFNANTHGIYSLIDSHVYMCEINANEDSGIRITAGSNDTTYIGNKVEWNNGNGYQIFDGNSSNLILGGIIDRNGKAGVSITSQADIIISGVKFRRNGRSSELDSEQDAHIALRGSVSGVKLIGIATAAGADDDGGSYNSPSRSITASNTASVIDTIVGCDLTGATGSIFEQRSGGSLEVGSLTGNKLAGTPFGDSVNLLKVSDNTGLIASGETAGNFSTGNYSGGTVDGVFSGLEEVSSYTRRLYEVNIITRNTGNGSTGIQKFMVAASREGGGTSAVLEEVFASAGSVPTVTAAFNTSGEELTLTLDPSSSSYNSEVIVSRAD